VQFFDDSFGEMRPLCQLILNLLVDVKLLFQLHDRGLQFFVFEDYLLGLLALIFKLACKLVVLQHGQSSGCFQFFLFETEKVLPHLSYLVSHL